MCSPCVHASICVCVCMSVCMCACNQFKQNMHMAAFQAAVDGIKLLEMFFK